jgi:signal transduction histidine kinase
MLFRNTVNRPRKEYRSMRKLGIWPLIIILTIAPLSYCFFWFSEDLLVQNSLKSLDGQAYKSDIYQLTRTVHRSLCDSKRLSYCSVEFRDPGRQIVFSVPGHANHSPAFFFTKSKEVKLEFFTENVSLLISETPTLKHLMFLVFFSLVVLSPFVVVVIYVLKRSKYAESERFNRITRQVAHDIRSPVGALKIALSGQNISEGQKNDFILAAAERIDEIANDLLNKKMGERSPIIEKPLNGLIKKIILEKELQYAINEKVEIKITNVEDLTIYVREQEFLRVLSNLFNNSVEAQAKIITITGEAQGDDVFIHFKDDGHGIPTEVLKHLGNQAISFGKDEHASAGSGIGILHAKKEIEKMGGKLTINSELGKGTEIIIQLSGRKNSATDQKDYDAVLLDNDKLVHLSWKMYAKNNQKRLISFYNFQALQSFLENKPKDIPIYIDYDLAAEKTGEEYAVILAGYGFSNLHLATGEVLDSFKENKIFKTVQDKTPKF